MPTMKGLSTNKKGIAPLRTIPDERIAICYT